MDLETLRLILPVAGTLLGVVLGGFSAYLVALANIRGQREIAHDNAKREQRLRQVAPFLERANHRLVLYRRMVVAYTLTDEGLRKTTQEQLLFGDELLGDLGFTAITDSHLVQTMDEVVAADEQCRDEIFALLRLPSGSSAEVAQVRAAFQAAIMPFVSTIQRLNVAADVYVIGLGVRRLVAVSGFRLEGAAYARNCVARGRDCLIGGRSLRTSCASRRELAADSFSHKAASE